MYVISNKILFLLVTIYSVIGVINSCYSETNIAIGKSYKVSPKPNYKLSAPRTDVTSLTDGKYTIGHFWSKKSTVGWQKAGPIEIIIDLENIFTVASISFNTARSEAAGVVYPANVHAFIGIDREHFLYLGDIAKDSENVPGPYTVKKFVLGGLEAKGRYVLLEIHSTGPFFFCDEIEVIDGKRDNGAAGMLSVDEVRKYSNMLRLVTIDKKILEGLIEEVKPSIANQPQLAARLNAIENRIQNETLENTEAIETELLELRGKMLRLQHPREEFLVNALNPWMKVSPVYPIPQVPRDAISLVMPVGGYDFAAFLITNLASDTRQYSILLTGNTSDMPEILLHEVPFLKSAALENVADPLIPLKGSIILRPGESKMVHVAAYGNNVGKWQNMLKILCGTKHTSVSVSSQVVNLALPSQFSLNSVVWNYLDFRLTRDRKTEAMKDLFDHHAKVVVLYPGQLALTAMPSDQDFNRMNSAFELQRNADKALLFLNHRDVKLRNAGGRHEYLSARWKEWFRTWYDKVVKSASANGFKQEQIYLYPYDEMGGAEIDQFIAFATWVRGEIPGIRLYATLGKENSEKALPYLDIAQVVNSDEVLRKFRSSTAELWLYDAKGPAKSLSPYSYYRLMAWKAFLNGYKGIGFWAYADTGWGDKGVSAWDDFAGDYPGFAVIYEGPENTIISSRRWEAWRMGIEDYELLTMYAKAKGDKAAKNLAEAVFSYPGDPSKADEVRRKILNGLSMGTN